MRVFNVFGDILVINRKNGLLEVSRAQYTVPLRNLHGISDFLVRF